MWFWVWGLWMVRVVYWEWLWYTIFNMKPWLSHAWFCFLQTLCKNRLLRSTERSSNHVMHKNLRPAYLSIYLSMSVCLSSCLSVCLSIYLSIEGHQFGPPKNSSGVNDVMSMIVISPCARRVPIYLSAVTGKLRIWSLKLELWRQTQRCSSAACCLPSCLRPKTLLCAE